jgi:hypothetical protein
LLQKPLVDVRAAHIGIPKNRWNLLTEEEASKDVAGRTMASSRFDILPVAHKNEQTLKGYFKTVQPGNYNEIEFHAIEHHDIIPERVNLRELIDLFHREERFFYFVCHEHSLEGISGLVSVVHLNNRLVRVFLYNLLTELELLMSEQLATIPESQLLELLEESNNTKHQKLINHFHSDQKEGYDTSLVEYLYLSDLVNFTMKLRIFSRLGYSRTRFDDHLNSLVALRNRIAHPSRSIVDNKHTIHRLWKRLDRLDEALFRLKSYSHLIE